MNLDIFAHEQWFTSFARTYRDAEKGDILPLDLKMEHSGAVLGHARLLVAEESPSSPLGRACLLAALYHDVGRFPQYARWHTFKDSLSTNHGLLGLKTLKAHQRLCDESPEVRALVLAAVGMHNRFAVPAGLSSALRLVVDVVRDADKLDIFRVMAGHLAGEPPYNDAVVLHVPDEQGTWSPKVMDTALNNRVASYADLTSVNDLRILLCCWMYDLRFSATRRQLFRSNLVPQLLSALPPIAPLQKVRQHLLSYLEGLS